MAGRGGAAWSACLGLCLMLGAPGHACPEGPDAGALHGSDVPGAQAWFEDATDIYGHDIMGAVPDALTLVVRAHVMTGADCGDATRRVGAGADHVFEDIAPRLVDVTGDGIPEIVVVRSSLSRGAQLAVYGAKAGDEIALLAATPYIGQRNRWLAPAAIGDIDGDGRVELAFIDRPHLAKTLRIWRLDDGTLREVAAVGGLTNHAIGDEVIHGGLRTCAGGPQIILSDADRQRLLAVTFDGRTVAAADIGRFSPRAARAALTCG